MTYEQKDIAGFEGKYAIDTDGNVWSYRSKKYLKPRYTQKGYARVHLGLNTDYYVHRLVAKAFIPNPDELPFINHKDENKLNNKVENLEWCTQKYNDNYGTKRKRLSNAQKKKKPVIMYDKETQEKIAEFSSLAEASRVMNADYSNIRVACNSNFKRKCAGYLWKFKEERKGE